MNNRYERVMAKKILPKRKYHDGDIVEFDFEPNSVDIYLHKVIIIGVITGALYEKDGIRYKVRLRDNKRCMFGEMIVPEENINGTMAESVVTVKCDFCETRTHVNHDEPEDIERKIKSWEKLYCVGKKHHVLNMCHICIEVLGDIDGKEPKCPHDQCDTVSKRKKEYLEKHGIKLVDKL